jgi:hypothetical protein
MVDRMRFFLPEWDDLVDPGFDFSTDTPSAGRRSARESDVYLHELVTPPPFDGVLVSKSNVDQRTHSAIVDCGGIANYLRLPANTPVMGDCGAFQYIAEPTPPYSCEEILAYYDDLRFSYGITLDHVIPENAPVSSQVDLFAHTVRPEVKDRFELTLRNAERMLQLAGRDGSSVELIGCAQGWDAGSYREAVERLANMGYRYVALGGIARASDGVIRSVLATVADVAHDYRLRIHVLGVARLALLSIYGDCGVASCDSAATLMQAFKSARDNYHTPGRNYTAIRIPPVEPTPSPVVRRSLAAVDSADQPRHRKMLICHERAALDGLRSYASGGGSVLQAADAIEAYHGALGGGPSLREHYLQTLHDRPWESCDCPICRAVGVEVVIMRGNNRNRRRAFHNTTVFYQQFSSQTH